MKKKEKLNLSSLKVNSFVTNISKASIVTVKGGGITEDFSVVQCASKNCDNTELQTNICSEVICQATFGTGGPCDKPETLAGPGCVMQ